MSDDLKRCTTDPSHIWMADIPMCPYCHCSPEFRVAMAERERRRRD